MKTATEEGMTSAFKEMMKCASMEGSLFLHRVIPKEVRVAWGNNKEIMIEGNLHFIGREWFVHLGGIGGRNSHCIGRRLGYHPLNVWISEVL